MLPGWGGLQIPHGTFGTLEAELTQHKSFFNAWVTGMSLCASFIQSGLRSEGRPFLNVPRHVWRCVFLLLSTGVNEWAERVKILRPWRGREYGGNELAWWGRKATEYQRKSFLFSETWHLGKPTPTILVWQTGDRKGRLTPSPGRSKARWCHYWLRLPISLLWSPRGLSREPPVPSSLSGPCHAAFPW